MRRGSFLITLVIFDSLGFMQRRVHVCEFDELSIDTSSRGSSNMMGLENAMTCLRSE